MRRWDGLEVLWWCFLVAFFVAVVGLMTYWDAEANRACERGGGIALKREHVCLWPQP